MEGFPAERREGLAGRPGNCVSLSMSGYGLSLEWQGIGWTIVGKQAADFKRGWVLVRSVILESAPWLCEGGCRRVSGGREREKGRGKAAEGPVFPFIFKGKGLFSLPIPDTARSSSPQPWDAGRLGVGGGGE